MGWDGGWIGLAGVESQEVEQGGALVQRNLHSLLPFGVVACQVEGASTVGGQPVVVAQCGGTTPDFPESDRLMRGRLAGRVAVDAETGLIVGLGAVMAEEWRMQCASDAVAIVASRLFRTRRWMEGP
jgi:hypothetical protein